MRRTLLLAILCIPALSVAQDLNGLMRSGSEVLIRERKIPGLPGSPNYQDPLEPRGNEGLPPRDTALPGPQRDNRNLIEIVGPAGEVRRTADRFHATGGIHIRYRGYDILANEVEGNTRTNIFTARGNVKVIGADSIVNGEIVTVDFDQRTFRAEQSDAQLRPSFVQGRVLDDLYMRGEISYGSEQEVWGEKGAFTTCNLDEPHYSLDASRINIRPYRRVILRKVAFKLFDRTLFTIPYISVPLDESGDRYTPDIGQSPDEGYYIKNNIGVPTGGSDSLLARLDYMTKLGTGLGGNYRYQSGLLAGVFRAYTVFGSVDTLNVDSEHRQKIGAATIDFKNDFQRNNYLNAPGASLLSSDMRVNFGQGTGLTYRRFSNESSGFTSVSQNLGVSDTRKVGSVSTNVGLNYSDISSSGSGNPVRREVLDVRLKAAQDLRWATAQLDYIRSVPVGEVANFFSPNDRTPVLSIRSDSGKLLGKDFGKTLPFQTEFSLGEFAAGRTGDKITRTSFDLRFNKPDTSGKRSTLSMNGLFKQGVYSDNTAQYATGLNLNYRYQFGRDTEYNFRYSFLRPYGFTPLSLDRVGRTNFVSTDIDFRPIRSLLIGAGTGYDFLLEQREQIAWQTVGLRAEFTPRPWFSARAYSTYDPFQHAFSNVRLDFAYLPGATRVTAGFRYDGIRQTWGNATLLIQDLKWGRLSFSTLLSYNGYLKKFEARHFSFAYDLHCAEAVLQIIDNPVGFRSGREITFFIRLKALPFDTPFGLGRRGQPLGGGTGRDY